MNREWKEFLESQSATVEDPDRVTFPASPGPHDCVLCDLSHLGLIAVEGPDALDFLQGQLTNDVRELSDRHSQLNSACNPKGRMLANFRMFRRGDTFYLQLPHQQLEPLLKRLGMFVLRSRVKLEDASDALVRIGVAGDCAPDLLRNTGAEIPPRGDDMASTQDVTLIRIPDALPRFQLVGPVSTIRGLWEQLAASATVVDGAYWSLRDIRSGIPNLYEATADLFVPQMANMQLIDGVSFTKGCYTGQEVVARMRYLGKLKRRMYGAEVSAAQPPQPGDPLVSPVSQSEQGAGRVLDAQAIGEDRYALLAVVEIDAAENGEVRLGESGPVLSFQDLPYSFDPER